MRAQRGHPQPGARRQAPLGGDLRGQTPALSDTQAAALLHAPSSANLKGLRDRAMLATLLYQGLRRDELCRLKVKDWRQDRRGVLHMKVSGKGGKTRYVSLHPQAEQLIAAYLQAAGHGQQSCGALFRSLQRARVAGDTKGVARGDTTDQAGAPGGRVPGISADGVYKIVKALSTKLGFGVGTHALRATAATNALDNQADLAKVQEWLGHAHIATTHIYDHRQSRSSDSPTFDRLPPPSA